MLHIIYESLNIVLSRKRKNLKPTSVTKNISDIKEIRLLIGLLYFIGIMNTNYLEIGKFWFNLHLNCIVPVYRMQHLIRCLCFDDEIENFNQEDANQFGPLRKLWHKFITNCQKYYIPSQYCTLGNKYVDLSTSSYEGYDCSDTEKLKLEIMIDTGTSYMFNAALLIEKEGSVIPPYEWIQKVSEPIHKKNRTIVINMPPITVDLLQTMLREYSLTMIGAVCINDMHIPNELKEYRNVGSSLFCYAKDMTLVSYFEEEEKPLLLLSSLYFIKEEEKDKMPEIVNVYNKSIASVNSFNELCNKYRSVSVHAGVRKPHWSSNCFFRMLDYAAVNAFILFTCNNRNEKMQNDEF